MFSLDTVVPWGRSFNEYRRMFALSDDDLQLKILGCADGPASFNTEAVRHGTRVVSVDPLYQWSALEIRARIVATAPRVLDQTRKNAHEFVWTEFESVEALGVSRLRTMDSFLADYQTAAASGRYVAAALPSLPFARQAFDLVVCSHFLFLYTTQMGERFHLDAVDELCRVAADVRIFPLLALGGSPSSHVPLVVDHLRSQQHDVSIEPVTYEFQRGGNQMLRVQSREGRPGRPARHGAQNG